MYVFCFGAIHSGVQELLLALRSLLAGLGPYAMPGIEPRSATCKANTLLLCYHSGPGIWFFKKENIKDTFG